LRKVVRQENQRRHLFKKRERISLTLEGGAEKGTFCTLGVKKKVGSWIMIDRSVLP